MAQLSTPRPSRRARRVTASQLDKRGGRSLSLNPKNAARRAIIREWMLLPREKRQSEEQAAAFALKAIEKHDLRVSGDRQRRVMAWLMPRVGKS